jgi:transcriptional regulator GlxA family with amidase domain
VEQFLLERLPPPDETLEIARRAVHIARSSPGLTSVRELADKVGVSVRVLEMRFRDGIGLSPKAVLRRYRIVELRTTIEKGTNVAWADLAAKLGYADQAHLIRDFKAQVGLTPTNYLESLAPTQARAGTNGESEA